jgi:hypothetical protein
MKTKSFDCVEMKRQIQEQLRSEFKSRKKEYLMALDDVSNLLQSVCKAFSQSHVPYTLVGGQAVALWVAQIDPAAVRTTKNVDLLLNRADLPKARAAAM